jgi:transposase
MGQALLSIDDSGGARARLKLIRDSAWLLSRHHDELMNYFMNYFRMPIHNGTVEGHSNNVKVISHKAYWFVAAKNCVRNLSYCMAELPL